jgi:hypothetical protein
MREKKLWHFIVIDVVLVKNHSHYSSENQNMSHHHSSFISSLTATTHKHMLGFCWLVKQDRKQTMKIIENKYKIMIILNVNQFVFHS